MLKITNVSDVKKQKARKDNKISLEYITVKVVDDSNLLAIHETTRNFTQEHSNDGKSASWGAFNVAGSKGLIGKKMPGTIYKETVLPYEVIGSDGTKRNVDTFTTYILSSEDKKQVFKQLGHPITEVQVESVELTAEETLN